MIVRTFLGFIATLVLSGGVAHAQSESTNDLTTIAYPVAHLVIPISANRDRDKTETNEAELIDRIHKKVAPKSWDRSGGPGSMRFERKSGFLLHVRQSAAVHAELKEFLQKLERGQVALDVRFLTLSEKAFEALNTGGQKWIVSDGIEHTLFDDAKLLHYLQAVQRDQTTIIMAMPKVTMFDGQDANCGVYDWMTFQTSADVQIRDGKAVAVPKDEKFLVGVKTRFLPTISGNRKYVALQTEIEIRNLVSESVGLVPVSIPVPVNEDAGNLAKKEGTLQALIQRPTFTELKVSVAAKIPDQRTLAVIAGKTMAEGRNEFGPPVLSRIPYVSRLFRNHSYGTEARTVVILLTPRIVGEPETWQVERLRNGIRAEADGQFPLIASQEKR
jgi:type II secretory pathway component GspD/PulD (secretin)